MREEDGIGDLETQADALEDSLGAAANMAAGFDAELRRIRESFAATGKDAATLERGLSKGLRRAFDGVVFDGLKLSDALEDVARSMIQTTYNAAIKPVANRVLVDLNDSRCRAQRISFGQCPHCRLKNRRICLQVVVRRAVSQGHAAPTGLA